MGEFEPVASVLWISTIHTVIMIRNLHISRIYRSVIWQGWFCVKFADLL